MLQRVYLDGAPGGPWMGHALAEMGCVWLAPKQGQAITMAPKAIAAFDSWLVAHGEPAPAQSVASGSKAKVPAASLPAAPEALRVAVSPADIQAWVVEIQEMPGFGKSGGAVGLFGPDAEPVGDEDIARAVRRLGYARQDLLGLVSALPAEVLDWQPPARKRTIRRNLVHVAQCHAFYLSRVLGRARAGEILPEPWPKETLALLEWTMTRSTEALTGLPAESRRGVFPATEPAEDWTPRKMLRRFVEHEVEHFEVVRKTIEAWRGQVAADAEAIMPGARGRT